MDCCIICSNEITNHFITLNCNCNYIYHNNCIQEWFQNNLSCPTCRKEFHTTKPVKVTKKMHLKTLQQAMFYDSINRWNYFDLNHNR